jgi:hypothetical protein
LCSSNGTHHANLLIVKGHFKSLSRINTSPVPTVLSINTPSQLEPSVISEKCKFCAKGTVMYCPQKKKSYKNAFSFVMVFSNYLGLCCFIRNRLSQRSVQCISCLKDPVERTFSPFRKSSVKLYYQHRDKGDKYPQPTFLRRESKAGVLRHVKEPLRSMKEILHTAKLIMSFASPSYFTTR